jgi:hypothetical protein
MTGGAGAGGAGSKGVGPGGARRQSIGQPAGEAVGRRSGWADALTPRGRSATDSESRRLGNTDSDSQ